VTETRAANILGAAILGATLLNGVGPFLRRVGLVERDAYERYWAFRCGPEGTRAAWLGIGRRCVVPEAWTLEKRRQRPFTAYVLSTQPLEYPLKAAKDLVLVGAFALALTLRNCHAAFSVAWQKCWPLWGLLLLILARAAIALAAGAGPPLFAGLRSLAFLPLTLAWTPVRLPLGRVAAWCCALALVEVALLPWDQLYGVTDRPTSWLWTRTAGTLVHPNTLGVLAVVAVGFVTSFAESRKLAALTWGAGACLVMLSASGAGWVILPLFAAAHVTSRIGLSALTKALILAAMLLFLLTGLPLVTGRYDVLLSVTEGRLASLGL
jgi:hypothetical protein